MFTLTDNKAREPLKVNLSIYLILKQHHIFNSSKSNKERKDTALFHSRISFGFGSGHDLGVNLIDLRRSESIIFGYQLPKNCTTDWDKFLAGRRDNWDVEALEVFLIHEPTNKPR